MKILVCFFLFLSHKAVAYNDSLPSFSENLKSLIFQITPENKRISCLSEFTVQKRQIVKNGNVSLIGNIETVSDIYGNPKTPDSYEIRIDSNGFYIDYAVIRNFAFGSTRSTELIALKEPALLFYPLDPQIGQLIQSEVIAKVQISTEEAGFGDPATRKPFMRGDNNNLYRDHISFVKVTDRKVIGKEKITIMDTEVEAIVIQHNVSSALKRDGNFKDEGYVKEWYTTENGLLAFGIYNRKDKLKLYGYLRSYNNAE